jgi:hypothetical protein
LNEQKFSFWPGTWKFQLESSRSQALASLFPATP